VIRRARVSDPARGHQVAGRLRRSRRSAIGCTAVMASGIVSLDLRSGRWEIASAALLVLAAAAVGVAAMTKLGVVPSTAECI
jgi:hypothetical protein